MINVAPIVDDRETVRGCLITFDDMSMVEHMNQALLDSVAQLEVAKHKIELQNEELKRLADHDQLTGSLTRRAFLEQSQQIFLKCAAQRANICILMVDIDHFKSINDRYGHLVGDQAIQQRGHDPRERGAAGRSGVPLRRRGVLRAARAASRPARPRSWPSACASRSKPACGPAVIPGENVRITASFGVASIQHGSTTLAELIKQADQALYAAKAAGRNRVLRHDQALALNQALLAMDAA